MPSIGWGYRAARRRAHSIPVRAVIYSATMAKVKSPLKSIRASGGIAGAVYFAHLVGRDRATKKRDAGSSKQLPQRRQATLVSEAARLWNVPESRGPETVYQEYIGAVSRENWFFANDAVLLEWSYDQLMPAR